LASVQRVSALHRREDAPSAQTSPAIASESMTLVLFGFALGYLVGLAAQRFIDDYRRG
jgi:hypothetical protein